MRPALVTTFALLAVAALAGCGGSGSSARRATTTQATSTQAPATTATTTASSTQTLRIYLLRDGLVSPVARRVEATEAVAHAALTELVAGPTGDEQANGLTTDVPAAAKLLGLTVSDGVATANFDDAFARGAEATIALRLAQVVYTLTQFPTIASVRFEQNGSPLPGLVDGHGIPVDRAVRRSDYEAQTPPILVESPLPGQSVTAPIAISGTAVAFEATFQTEVVDAQGSVVGRQTVTASAGGPARGTFSASVPVHAAPGPIRLVAYEDNQGTGQRMHVVTVPLQLAP